MLFNWKVDKIYIYPLGGVTVFKDRLNKPFIEELFVTIIGPLFQIITAYYLSFIDNNILLFSNTLLIFNLLPIIPLDGGRLSSIFIALFVPFKKSMLYVVKLSFIIWFLILFFIIKTKSLILIFSFILIIFKIFDESNKIKYLFIRFLIERTFNNYNGKSIIIYKIEDLYKYKKNLIIKNNHLYNEKEYIERFLM